MQLPIYVINLDRRPDRWGTISANLAQIGARAERIAAVDARLLEQQERWEWQTNDNPPDRQVDIGALACAWSHRKAMMAFLDTAAPGALILEDDAELAGDTGALLESTAWWPHDMLALRLETNYPTGRKWRCAAPLWPAEAHTPSGRAMHRFERFGGGAAAYILTRKGAETVHPALVDPEHPVDQLLWNKRRSRLARRLRPYQVVPAMARQRDIGSDLGAWCDADYEALGKAGRRRRRWMGVPHMAKVRLLMLAGAVRRTEVVYVDI